MPKKTRKKASRSASRSNYQHFKLHGNHPKEKVILLVAAALVVGFALGYFLQPNIFSIFGFPAGY